VTLTAATVPDEAEAVASLSALSITVAGYVSMVRLAENGYVLRRTGRPDLAEAALTDALGHKLSARRRGSVLTDLRCCVQRSDPDQVMHYARAALSC